MSSALFMPSTDTLSLGPRLKSFAPEIVGSVASGGTAFMSWQQAQTIVGILAGLASLTVSLFTLRSLLRKEKAQNSSK